MSKSKKKSVKVKKSAYKRKVKGVRYISSVLVKYFKRAYLNKREALPKAREIMFALSTNGIKVTIKSISELVRKPKAAKKPLVPYIDDMLLMVKPYFDMTDYPSYILRSSNEITFKSKLVPSGLPEIVGGNLYEYSTYFAPFVNYINKMASMVSADDNRYETDWLVVCTEPYYDSSAKKWFSDIISMDNLGDEVDYGFDPKAPSVAPGEVVVKGELPSGKAPSAPVVPSSDTVKEIEAKTKLIEAETKLIQANTEIERQKNIANALSMLQNKIITQEQFNTILNKI